MEQPVRAFESGPTAGVMAAAYVGELIGVPNILAFDMGGTTAKAGIILGGKGVEAMEYEVGGHVAVPGSGHLHGRGTGFPISLPAVEVNEIGAGGGSIAWIDPGGAFRVGPKSMGARPGPACYGFGGEEPTITDAHVILGVLNPANFLGGKMRLLPDRSAQAIETKLSQALGLTLQDGARGIIRVANAQMGQALRLVSVNKGHDPREFVLVAFGGAGPMHACDIAREMEIPWVVVPRFPGIHTSLGLVATDIVHEFVQFYPYGYFDPDVLTRAYEVLEKQGWMALDADRVPLEMRLLLRTADAKYEGQNYTVNIPIPAGRLNVEKAAAIVESFHTLHEGLNTFRLNDRQVKIVNLRLRAVGMVPRPDIKSDNHAGSSPEKAKVGERGVFFEIVGEQVETLIFDRSRLLPGNVIPGPAIIEQVDSTTAIPPGMIGTVDQYQNITIGKEEWKGLV
jgi:N-methylhydantoinase A